MKYIWFIYNGFLSTHYPVENIFYDTMEDALEASVKYGYNLNQIGVEIVNPWYDEETHELLGLDSVTILIYPIERVFEDEEE